jgi:hypothetical protein
MTSLPSFQAMWKADDHSTLQMAACKFPHTSAYFLSPSTHLTNLPPIVQQSLPRRSAFMNGPLFPVISDVQSGISSGHNHNQSGFWSGAGHKSSFTLDRALQQRMDVVTPPTEDPFENLEAQYVEVRASLQSNQPRQTLLQEQQKEVRERMEYLSSLLKPTSTPFSDIEVPKRSRDLSIATIEEDLFTEEIFDDHTEQLPAKKKQRVDNSSNKEKEKRFRTYQAEQWNEKFDDLVRFKNQHRHCCVSHTYSEDPSLVGQSKIGLASDHSIFCFPHRRF